jgi:arylsulfatase A-like enzyme
VCGAPGAGQEDFRGYDWFTGATPDATANLTRSTDRVAARAEAFLERAAGERAGAPGGAPPFMLALTFQNIHAPYDCAPESYARFAGLGLSVQQTVIYGYIYELDAAVGRVVAALQAGGLANDTVVVFVSDNGAPSAPGVSGRNYPLRGFKTEVWEGGTRVPALVVAPGRGVPPGSTLDALMHVTDWVPTLLGAAGVTDPAAAMGHALDGVNAWPLLTLGSAAAAAAAAAAAPAGAPPAARTDVVINVNPLCAGGQFGAPKAAFIAGDLKLVCWCYAVAGIDNATATGCVGDPAAPGAWPQLFNLTADPGEETNIAPSQPAAVAALEGRLAAYAAGSVEPMQWTPPYQGANYACAACPRHPPGGDPAEPWTAWL